MNKKIHGRKKKTWDDRIYDLVCNLFLVLFVLIVFYPIYYIVLASISDPNYVNSGAPLLYPKGITFKGYQEVFKDSRIMTGYANTILYTVCGTILGICMTVPAGYALSRKDLPGRGIVMKLYVFTMYFGGGMIPTFMVVKSLGLLNTRLVLILLGCVSVYNIIMVRSYMMSTIPDDLLNAARIDGCGNGRFFLQIVVPLSKAIISVIVLYVAVGYWNAYMNAVLYITDESMYPLQLELKQILYATSALAANADLVDMEYLEKVRENMEKLQLLKYCVIVVASVPIICVYPFIQKYFVKGVMIGAVKG